MANVNIYLSDELAAEARDSGLDVSRVCRHAVEDALSAELGDLRRASLVTCDAGVADQVPGAVFIQLPAPGSAG